MMVVISLEKLMKAIIYISNKELMKIEDELYSNEIYRKIKGD
jgi:hypothetical protein